MKNQMSKKHLCQSNFKPLFRNEKFASVDRSLLGELRKCFISKFASRYKQRARMDTFSTGRVSISASALQQTNYLKHVFFEVKNHALLEIFLNDFFSDRNFVAKELLTRLGGLVLIRIKEYFGVRLIPISFHRAQQEGVCF